MLAGTVRWFNEPRGLGVIVGDDGRDYLFQRDEVQDSIPLEEGMRVRFSPKKDAGGRKASAVQIIYRKVRAA